MKRVLLALALFCAFFQVAAAQSTLVVATKILDNTGNLLTTGDWCFGSTCFVVTNGSIPSGSAVTPGSATVTVTNGPVTFLTVPNVTIAGSFFSWDTFTAPSTSYISGMGVPRIACTPGAIYSQTDGAQNKWQCISQNGSGSWNGLPAPGATNTVAVGTVTTLPVGSPAAVVNVGTGSAAILNFGIPQGPQGPQGPIGAPTSGVNLTPSASQSVTQPIVNGQQTVLSISAATVPTWKQTYGVGAFAYPGVNEFGDSITAGNGATIQGMGWTATDYAAIIGRAFGAPVKNYARGGDMAADMAWMWVYPNLVPEGTNQPATTMMIGTNDADVCGASVGCQQNYTHSLLASVAWAAIPNGNKILFGSNTQSVTTTGTWAQDSQLAPDWALACTTAPCTLTFTTFTPSTVMYLAWKAADASSTTAALTCDSGTVTDTLSMQGYDGQTIATQNGTVATVFANRYVFPTFGTHNCTITPSSSAYPFDLVWAGSPLLNTPNPYVSPSTDGPRVFLGGVIQELNGVNSSTSALYNTIAETTANQLAADGLNVAFVDTRDAVNTTTDMSGTPTVLANGAACPGSTLVGAHPNDCGHSHIASAFLSVAQPVSAGSSAFGLYPCQNGILCAGNGAPGDTSSYIYAAEYAAVSGTTYNILKTTGLGMNSTSPIGWGPTAAGGTGTDTGLSRISAGIIGLGNGYTPGDYSATTYAARYAAASSSENNSLYPNGLGLNNASPVVWNSGVSGSLSGDTGLSRLSAGIVALGNGAQGDESGGLALSGVITQYITPRLTAAPTGSCSAFVGGTIAPSTAGTLSICVGGTWTAITIP